MIRLYGQDRPSTVNEQANMKIGAYHLAEDPSLYEPQRSNNFEFIVPNLDGLLIPGTNIRIENAQEILRLSVNSSFVPTFAIQPIEIRRGNSSFKVAGTPTFSSGQVQFKDFIGADTCGILEAWHAMTYNVETQKGGLMTDYKRDAYLIAYTPDHQKVRQWILKGCFLSALNIPEFSNNGQNSERLISATIDYDWARLDPTEMLE